MLLNLFYKVLNNVYLLFIYNIFDLFIILFVISRINNFIFVWYGFKWFN